MHASGVKTIPIAMRNPVIEIMDANLEISELKHRRRKGHEDDLVEKKAESQPNLLSDKEEKE